jgi:hypothetical protein
MTLITVIIFQEAAISLMEQLLHPPRKIQPVNR